MHWIRFAVIVLLAAILQTSLISIIAIGNSTIKPDLMLILLVFFAIHCEPFDAVIASFAIGFAADLTGPAMGTRMISFGLCGTLLGEITRVVTIKKKLHQGIIIFAVCIITSLLIFLLTIIKGNNATISFWSELMGRGAYSAVTGPFLFVPLAWLMSIKKRRSARYG